MLKDIKIIAPGRDTIIWITPTDLRAIARKIELIARRSKGHYGCYSIGNNCNGKVYFQYDAGKLEVKHVKGTA